MLTEVGHTRECAKKLAKIFFSLASLPNFFSKISFCSQQPLRCCRNDPKTSAEISNCQNTLWTRVKRSLRFVTLDNARKYRPKSFLHREECIFFWKIVFSTTAWVLQKWSCNFHSIYEITFWTLMNHLLRSTTLDESGENITKTFFHWNVCLFFKSLCFQQLLRCNRIIPITSKAIVKIDCGYSQTRPWGLSHSRMREKNWTKTFFLWKVCLFFKSLCFQQLHRCYRINPVTSTVIVKTPCGPSYNVPWGLSHSRVPEKLGQKLFFTGNFAFFAKICVFNNFLGVTELIL